MEVRRREIEYGANVIDKNGKVLGTVNRVVRDSWTGDIRKFGVGSEERDIDLLIPPDDVAEATINEIKLKVAFD